MKIKNGKNKKMTFKKCYKNVIKNSAKMYNLRAILVINTIAKKRIKTPNSKM